MEREVSHILNALVGCVAMRYAAEKSSKEITDTEVLLLLLKLLLYNIIIVNSPVVLLYTCILRTAQFSCNSYNS